MLGGNALKVAGCLLLGFLLWKIISWKFITRTNVSEKTTTPFNKSNLVQQDVLDDGATEIASDCNEARKRGNIKSGVYLVKLSAGRAAHVWCNMEVSQGWTVIQRRIDDSVDFNRDWDDYKNGFGYFQGNFWLGLDSIHMLTKKPRKLRISMKSSGWIFASFSHFKVKDESTNYQLEVGGLTSTDKLSYYDDLRNVSFSTFDHNSNRCIESFKGGWWMDGNYSCSRNNLNGKYSDKIRWGERSLYQSVIEML